MKRSTRRTPRLLTAAALAACGTLTACAPDGTADAASDAPTTTSARSGASAATRQYGAPVTLGEGEVRTYVVMDDSTGRTPVEIGIAIDARTMEGKLPAEMKMFALTLPPNAPEPYRFALFDWNPQGHIPEGVYDVPHFDFHFYWMPHSEVQTITRDDPNFAAKANNLPKGDFVPPNYIVPAPPGVEPAALTEPRMGLHWEDVRDPQLQRLLGNPDAYQPFTTTFIYGSWDGRMIFAEPMITREYLMRRKSETIPVPQPARYPQPGWYPGAYSITYDAKAKEYRVAIVDFTWRE